MHQSRRPSRVLVTGSGGFLGRALVQRLRAGGHDVRGWSREDDGDLVDTGSIARVVGRFRPTRIVHLAARLPASGAGTNEFVRDNVGATLAVAQACAETSIPLTLGSTTNATLGDGAGGGLPPDTYSLTKSLAELTAIAVAPVGLQVLRLHFPYGPGASANALTRMFVQAASCEPIKAFANIRRPWCYKDDVVDGMCAALERCGSAGSQEEAVRGIGRFDVGVNEAPLDLPETARLICRIVGVPEDLVDAVPVEASPIVQIDPSPLTTAGWTPRVSFDDGLRRTWAWVREELIDG